MSDTIWVDVSLRDGELTPGVRFEPEQKLAIARALFDAGVNALEVGFPGKISRDRRSLTALATSLPSRRLVALCRSEISDIDAALRCLDACERPRLHLFAGGETRQTLELVEQSARAVRYAHQHCGDVQFSPLDATRLKPDYLRVLCQAVVDAGAATVNISDTLGVATPYSVQQFFTFLLGKVSGEVSWSFHGHNDLGLATANALAALLNGATQVEACVNGLGPRAGNAALEEVVAAFGVAQQQTALAFPGQSGVSGLAPASDSRAAQNTAYLPDLDALQIASELIGRYTGISMPNNKALFGKWAIPPTLASIGEK